MKDTLGRKNPKRSANWDSDANTQRKKHCAKEKSRLVAIKKRSSSAVAMRKKKKELSLHAALTEAARLRCLGKLSLRAVASRVGLSVSMITRL